MLPAEVAAEVLIGFDQIDAGGGSKVLASLSPVVAGAVVCSLLTIGPPGEIDGPIAPIGAAGAAGAGGAAGGATGGATGATYVGSGGNGSGGGGPGISVDIKVGSPGHLPKLLRRTSIARMALSISACVGM
jgi:hypothetical protein